MVEMAVLMGFLDGFDADGGADDDDDDGNVIVMWL